MKLINFYFVNSTIHSFATSKITMWLSGAHRAESIKWSMPWRLSNKDQLLSVLIARLRCDCGYIRTVCLPEHLPHWHSHGNANCRFDSWCSFSQPRTECLNHRNANDEPLPVSRLIGNLGNNLQIYTLPSAPNTEPLYHTLRIFNQTIIE